ncbi:MAG: APC family permease [Deltaproteobacteria bacterium]|nr:APC family permease [Deltaproteobacteria bacterium]
MADLRRVLSAPSVALVGAGYAFATLSIVADVQVASLMPGATGWMAVVVAGLVCLLASSSFAELSAMFPSSAGVRLYLQKAFGDRFATAMSSAYIFTVIAASGAEAYVFGSVFEALIPRGPPVWVYMVAAFAVVGVINYRGIELSAGFQNALSLIMFVFLLGVSVAALVQFGGRLENWTNPFATGATAEGLISAVAVAIFLYAGFEWVTALAEEAEDPRVIPRGMAGSVVLLGVVYGLLNLALVSAVPKEVLSGAKPWLDGVNYGARPHVVFVKVVFGPYETLGLVAAGALSFLASMTSFNAGILTTSRFLYAMSRDRTMPRVLSRIHPEYFTPAVAVVTLTMVALVSSMLLLLFGGFNAFTFAVAGSEALMLGLVAVCVMRLRRKEPAAERAYRVPLHPVSTLAIALIFAFLFVTVFLTPQPEARVGLAIYVAIVLFFVGYTLGVVPRLKQTASKASEARTRTS